ncbi:hypothetical protein MUP77_22565 [Candidatus Bathyarchaeota archaeon]|nr:hypothetical protein [Candidatus Bathyarchaeota archaeon]
MRKIAKARSGQFLIITAFIVLIILTAAVASIYSGVQNNPFTETVKLANAMNEVDLSIKKILGFTVGYYGSILQVTGNATYAREKTDNYFYSGLVNLEHSHLDSATSFRVERLDIQTQWFQSVSWSRGNVSLDYTLPSSGLEGIKIAQTSSLQVEMVNTINNQSIVNVKKNGNYPDLSLTKDNFFFYSYDNENSQWDQVNPETEPTISVEGNYILDLPSGVSKEVYLLKVVDNRGIIVQAFSSPTGKSQYSYTFNWNSTLYQGLNSDTIAVELLQNGTLRWLGEKLDIGNRERPIPPLLVSAIHVNQTIDGINEEVPFQIEYWGSEYSIPLGFASNASILSSSSIIVFLLNHHVSQTTIWWDGRDTATQTAYAWTNRYFQNDDPDSGKLTNGKITLDLTNSQRITATANGVTSRCEFLRVNGREPSYGSGLSYTIHHGIVRDVIQQEAEWAGGITDCPNIYSHIVITLPANTTYYTFKAQTIFLPSNLDRDITDLSAIQFSADRGTALTENGVTSGKPVAAISPNEFYDGGTEWAHHWSEYIDSSNKGAGIMFRDATNTLLYGFDVVAGAKTGALDILQSSRQIEMNPIKRFSVQNFQNAYDISWDGAVTVFSSGNPNDTIYPYANNYIYSSNTLYKGLWIIVEQPPIVSGPY